MYTYEVKPNKSVYRSVWQTTKASPYCAYII